MRHYPKKQSYDPVLDVARNYLNYNQPYSHGKLYALGLLLLYKRFTPNVIAQKVMVKIFKKIASELLDYVDRYIYPGKFPMYCSQFVYRCYEEAGDEYCLGIVENNSSIDAQVAANGKSLLRQVIHRIRNDASDVFRSYIMEYSDKNLGVDISQSDTDLAIDLVNALQAKSGQKNLELDNELVMAIHEFSQAVYRAMTGINIDYYELEHANRIGMTTTGLSLLSMEESDFVTPGDLFNNCANLRLIGEIAI
jgi:hypothetical protein